MSDLVRNVHVRDHGWFGPAHGNADSVPAEVAVLITNPLAWDTPPDLEELTRPDGQEPAPQAATPEQQSTPAEASAEAGEGPAAEPPDMFAAVGP